jgi:hypothetical protein
MEIIAMNDNFLYQYRPPVRKEFAKNLYQRLSNQKGKRIYFLKNPSALVWKFALAAILGLSLLFTFSEQVRAGVLELIRNIGGFNVEEVEMAPTFAPNPTVYVYTPQPLSSALQDLPFTFAMPVYIPDGYILGNDIVVAESKDWVSLQWTNSEGQELNMLVQQDWNLSLPASADGAEEIQINGEPALLLRGGWSADGSGKWDTGRNMIQLYWRHAGLIYSFQFWNLPPGGDNGKFVQELIRVAESIQ